MLYAVFLFFFVKQKTAYEMRISDWSSDVCSSDLFLAHNSVDGFEYPHGLTLEQYQNLRRLAAYLMALPEDYAKFDMGWWTADSRSPGATTRSEEHTSELQSLMRISYAVFCLKKKNTTTNAVNTLQPKS